MKKISRSWGVTLLFAILVAVLPFANGLLANYGIEITEAELTHFLTAFGITAGAGIVNKVRKQINPQPILQPPAALEKNDVKDKLIKELKKVKQHVTTGIKFGPVGAWYQTNFIKTNAGNTLEFGQSYLWILIPSTKYYISVTLRDSTQKVIQVDQSFEKDEDNNVKTARLEMFERNGKPLERGEYTLRIQSDVDTGEPGRGIQNDKFQIV